MPIRDIALLIGPPGAGKGTIGQLLNHTALYTHLAMGDIFRSLTLGTPDGDLHAEYVRQGRLLPDEMALRLLISHLSKMNNIGSKFLVLDGYPRTVPQYISLKEHFMIKAVAVVKCEESALISRCLARAEEQGRKEEKDIGIVVKRIESFNKQTRSILDHLDPAIVIIVENNKSPEIAADKIATFFYSKLTL